MTIFLSGSAYTLRYRLPYADSPACTLVGWQPGDMETTAFWLLALCALGRALSIRGRVELTRAGLVGCGGVVAEFWCGELASLSRAEQ